MYQIVLLCDKLVAMCIPGKLEKSLSLLEFKKKGWAEERQKQTNTGTRQPDNRQTDSDCPGPVKGVTVNSNPTLRVEMPEDMQAGTQHTQFNYLAINLATPRLIAQD